MPSQRSVPPSAQAAVSSGGGCLSGFILPPLTVMVVGLLLAFLLLGSSNLTTTPDMLAREKFQETASIELPGTTVVPLAALFTPEVEYWAGQIQNWAAEAKLDPNLVATVMQIESCGDPYAHSPAGAKGLFQVMPYHFFGTDNPYDPATNARRGLEYLRRSLEIAGGDVRLAFAGYNGGIGVIGRNELSWEAETQHYAYWASGIYSDAAAGASYSPRLQEWLAAGGSGLCRQAQQRLGIRE